ncbi:hypothetical protein BGZ97_006810 [Linnemannia gamsii]|uniref:Uncharacterized protein n=1 Tax=Linnemannia gamsii TaxID=64522 RepID=A0A9P6UFJ5_9FUNG|nr:hypothetical protein BGZ97_006810 [Linnemannia gamsii]
MEYQMENKLRLRKRHFTDVLSGLSSSFYWSLESRENFATYGNPVLSYCVPDLLQTLGVSRFRLAALATVSHNNY